MEFWGEIVDCKNAAEEDRNSLGHRQTCSCCNPPCSCQPWELRPLWIVSPVPQPNWSYGTEKSPHKHQARQPKFYLANILICNDIKCKTRLRMPCPSNSLAALLTNAFRVALQWYLSTTKRANPYYDLHTDSTFNKNHSKSQKLIDLTLILKIIHLCAQGKTYLLSSLIQLFIILN